MNVVAQSRTKGYGLYLEQLCEFICEKASYLIPCLQLVPIVVFQGSDKDPPSIVYSSYMKKFRVPVPCCEPKLSGFLSLENLLPINPFFQLVLQNSFFIQHFLSREGALQPIDSFIQVPYPVFVKTKALFVPFLQESCCVSNSIAN